MTNQRGDTIVEVLLATALLSGILFTSWSIVNRASQISLAARQRVAMVDQLKEQAEIITSYYSANGGKAAVSQGKFGSETMNATGNSSIQDNPCDASRASATLETNGVDPVGSYYFDTDATLENQMKSINVDAYDNAKVWVQRVPVGSPVQAYDYYIQACWLSSGGGTQKEDNTKIIVRLNI